MAGDLHVTYRNSTKLTVYSEQCHGMIQFKSCKVAMVIIQHYQSVIVYSFHIFFNFLDLNTFWRVSEDWIVLE